MSENRKNRFWLLQLPVIFRSGGWWEFKFGPILALVYGTALHSDVSLIRLWPSLLGTVVALAGVGAWANVLNDWMDIEEDRAAGKSNRMAGRSRWEPLLIVVLTGIVGWAAALWLRPGPVGLLLYTANCVAFFFYSVPPVRLKTRGGWGVLADAAGAHTLPALFAVVATGLPLQRLWLALVTVWSFAYGLRGILWHQLWDYENDRRTGGFTFVSRSGPGLARRLGEWVVFPLELLALAGVLWWSGSALPVVLLVCDAWLVWLRKVYHYATTIIVAPCERFRIRLHEFNYSVLPVAFLVAASARNPRDSIILVAHCLLFPVGLLGWVSNLVGLTWRWVRESARGQRSR